ncbi:MAG: flagellar filament capping protein FliD, partial [Acidimicrobiales bacterium]
TAGFISLRASDSGGAIKLGQLKYGSSGNFTVTNSGALGLDGTNTAQDVVGTIDGVATTGTGQTLLSTSGNSDGLGITIQLTDGEITAGGGSVSLGTMVYARGLMGQLSEVIGFWEGTDGTLARAQDRWEEEIDTYDDRIADFELRLEKREKTLRRQFTSMETALSNLQGQSSYLASVLGIGTAKGK